MSELIHPVCLVRGVYLSAKYNALVSGHFYETANEPTPTNVHLLRCRVCGHVSVSWSWNSLEGDK